VKITLNSTSFLLPNNESWSILKKNNNINFSDYGNINSGLNAKNKAEIDVTLFFLPDLIDYFQLDKLDYRFETKKISNIIKLIEQKLKLKNKKFIVSLSEYFYNNIINFSKNISFSKKIKSYFLDELYKLSRKYNNFYIFDLDNIFSDHGYNNCFDQRNFYAFRCRLSTLGIKILSKNLEEIINRINFTNKKVLLLDCDNTIWGGVLAEDGMENIQIGQDGIGSAFLDFQKAIKKIKSSGVLIALVSKNDKSDVENVLKNHQSMILKKNDITAMKINWNEKSDNIKQLAKGLFLGLNSFVFWDDNPIEREKVRAQLKDIEVIEPSKDISDWPKQLLEFKGFSKFIITKEDKVKTKQYKNREKFIEAKHSSKNEINYLKSIKIKPKIIKINKSTLNRTLQLCQKTNQFNLRTKIYSMKDINKLNKKNICFLVHLKDNYGDHGIISFICLKIIEKKFLFIDTFLMSCRILGRHLESWILNEIKKLAIKNKLNFIIAEYIPTKRNQVAKDFILKSCFEKVSKEKVNNYNIFFKKLMKENSNSEFYTLTKNSKIPNLEIYEKSK